MADLDDLISRDVDPVEQRSVERAECNAALIVSIVAVAVAFAVTVVAQVWTAVTR